MSEVLKCCSICCKPLVDSDTTVKLSQKGCDGINRASETRDDSICTVPGQFVHKECRRLYCNPNVIARDRQDKENVTPRSLRSNEVFSFKEHCLFCGQFAKSFGKKRGNDVFPVRTLDFQKKVLDICSVRVDKWADEVRGRLVYACDLPAVETVYHQSCNVNFRTGREIPCKFSPVSCKKSRQARGRPILQDTDQAFRRVIDYFKDHDDEQLTISDLVEKMREWCGDKAFSSVYMKSKLEKQFGESLLITEINGKQNVVTLRHTASSILHEFYSAHRSDNVENQKIEVLKTAAKLIKNDVKSVCAKTNYPSSADIASVEINKRFVPESLKQFLGDIFSEKKCDIKICSIGQAIMQAARPRAIIAPLQLGLGVQLHQHFASKFLLDILNNLGFCVSYSEVQMFEASAALTHETNIQTLTPDTFLQYSADNVDHNLRTIDGHNTFHGMGMIACLTPVVICDKVVPRRNVSKDELLSAGKIDISFFRTSEASKPTVLFAELQDLKVTDSSWKLTFLAQITWPLRPPGPEWSGFMQMISTGEYPGKSSIDFLPMIDMDPTDMSCIYTTLTYITSQAVKYNQTPVVTFDQPLYWKALTIILSESESSSLKNVVLRLGGFHCIMSFLGCIGHLMTGSGLNELIETVYAPNAVSHILTGKAVARAQRGHFLIDSALNVFLVSKYLGIEIPVETSFECEKENADKIDIPANDTHYDCNNNVIDDKEMHIDQSGDNTTAEEDGCDMVSDSVDAHIQTLANLYDNIVSGDISVQAAYDNYLINKYSEQLVQIKQELKKYPTAALWIQYMEMINILRQFLTAERTGNWELSLQSLYEMLPYFAAAGHNLYLKSVYFYLQTMQNLQSTHPSVYQAFSSGHHVIRRSDRYWGGLSTDLVIEQVLMRSVKTTGGMTRGKGMTECQRSQWLLSMPSCAEINNAMQSFCGSEFHTSLQHKEMGKSRKERDYKDTKTFLSFIAERNPFRTDPLLCNIETGVTSGNDVSAHKAKELGNDVVDSMKGKCIFDISFKKSQKAVTLDTSHAVKVDDEIIKVDQQLLFQRLTAAAQRFVEDIPHVFSFELCSVPSSLFDMTGLIRESHKSLLADSIWGLGDCNAHVTEDESEEIVYVLDGGSLIHRIPWTRGMLFSQICERYVQYVSNRYSNAVIVFDGYVSGPTTKDTCHTRRTHGTFGTKVYFTMNTPFRTTKDKFLSNLENKQNFILMLSSALENKSYSVVHANGDADLLIVQTALNAAKEGPTIIIGEDTDILVLLLYHTNSEHKRVYFKSDLNQRTSKGLRILDIQLCRQLLGNDLCRVLPVLHAITGCDTTSRLYGISKGNALKKFRNDEQMKGIAEVFLKESSREEIVMSGEKLLVSLYGGLPIEGLDLLRFRKFSNKVISCSIHIQVHSLPPTSAAAKYHSLRTYFQVNDWIDSNITLDPQDWGWIPVQGKLIPVKTDIPAAPDNLLKMVRCMCKLHCDSKRCTCRKHGLECTSGCGECRGISCSNAATLTESDLSNDS